MAWNEPGGDKKDPWGGRGGGEGPPDLDEIVRNVQNRLGGLFGGRSGGGNGGGSGGGGFSIGGVGMGLILVAVSSESSVMAPS